MSLYNGMTVKKKKVNVTRDYDTVAGPHPIEIK